MKKTILAVILLALTLSLFVAPISAVSEAALSAGKAVYEEKFDGTLDALTADGTVKTTVKADCELKIEDGKLVMQTKSSSNKTGDIFVDIYKEFPARHVIEMRYMVERAVDGEGSIACFIHYPSGEYRCLTNANTGGNLKYMDGEAGANTDFALETKTGVWYTMYITVDTEANRYSLYRKADGGALETLVENIALQAHAGGANGTYFRIMTQRNSDALAYVDSVIIREYDPNYVETTAAPETAPVTVPAPTTTPSAAQTADASVLIAMAVASSAVAAVLLRRKER